MNKKSITIIAALLTILAICGIMTGCGSNNSDGNTTNNAVNSSDASNNTNNSNNDGDGSSANQNAAAGKTETTIDAATATSVLATAVQNSLKETSFSADVSCYEYDIQLTYTFEVKQTGTGTDLRQLKTQIYKYDSTTQKFSNFLGKYDDGKYYWLIDESNGTNSRKFGSVITETQFLDMTMSDWGIFVLPAVEFSAMTLPGFPYAEEYEDEEGIVVHDSKKIVENNQTEHIIKTVDYDGTVIFFTIKNDMITQIRQQNDYADTIADITYGSVQINLPDLFYYNIE